LTAVAILSILLCLVGIDLKPPPSTPKDSWLKVLSSDMVAFSTFSTRLSNLFTSIGIMIVCLWFC